MLNKYNKIYFSLLGAAIGDAMGCPVETRPVPMVKKDFGNGDFVYDYCETLGDSIAYNMERAWVTDDFSIAYLSAQHYFKSGGKINTKDTNEALIDWKYNPATHLFYEHYCGPTSRKGIARLEGEEIEDPRAYMYTNNKTATNGAGMKAWLAGLFNAGNLDKAVNDALIMCIPSHDNPIALSAGCAVAAAASMALVKDARLDQVVEAGIYGANEGLKRSEFSVRPSSGASVAKRIELAVSIGVKYANDFEKCVVEMTDLISTGLNANESVRSAFGYLVASGGDALKAIYLGVNSGNDSDSTAIVSGSIAGALYGIEDKDSYHKTTLEKANPFIDFEKMTKQIYDLY